MRRKHALSLSLLLFALLLSGCGDGGGGTLVSNDETYETTGEDAGDYELEDNRALSREEEDVVTMYLTVGRIRSRCSPGIEKPET